MGAVVKTFFSLAAVLTSVLGVLWLFFPQAMLGAFGAPQPDAIAVYMARRYGALFFGYAATLWLGRASASSPALKAILGGGVVVSVVICIVSLVGVLFTGVVGPAVWGAGVVEALLAALFIYYYARAR